MNQLEEKIEKYLAEAKKLGLDLSEELIIKATKALVPTIYNKDSETVSCSQNHELDVIKKNFVRKKLGITDDKKIDEAIKKVCEAMGSSNRTKYRPLFYALLAKELGKESIYA